MEFEDEHEEEQEEEEEDDEEDITIPPPVIVPPSYDPVGGNTNSVPHRPRVIPERSRSGVTRYRECLKNHAVSIGGHAVDGCGEFMPAGAEGTLDALKCAACNCHRNFHRKETESRGGDTSLPPTPQPSSGGGNTLYPQFSAYYRNPAAPPSGYLHVSGPPPHHQHHHHHHQQHQHQQQRNLPVVPYTSGGTHSGEMDDMSHPSSSGGGGGGGGMSGGSGSKKRYRTKFSGEQKDKMLEFAEKLGWRIQKHDEGVVQQFCDEIQIKRQVLKVWMHNNKHTLGKKP